MPLSHKFPYGLHLHTVSVTYCLLLEHSYRKFLRTPFCIAQMCFFDFRRQMCQCLKTPEDNNRLSFVCFVISVGMSRVVASCSSQSPGCWMGTRVFSSCNSWRFSSKDDRLVVRTNATSVTFIWPRKRFCYLYEVLTQT